MECAGRAISRRMRAEYPDARGSDTGIRVVSLHDAISGRVAPMLRLLLAAVVLLFRPGKLRG